MAMANQTIYVNNIYEKMGMQKLKKCLTAMFTQFGPILDIVCSDSQKMRGQAWVVFSDINAATNALRTMQGFPFFEKPIAIQYAKTKSDAVAKLDGTYQKKEKKGGETGASGRDENPKKAAHGANSRVDLQLQPMQAVGPTGQVLPNKILFVQNLPETTNEMMLNMLFQQYPGFREVRMVESRPGIAFVEFENEQQSSTAMENLQGFQITPQFAMNISYAKQ
ncbi:hypothetical protein BSKO_07562 [Bryopsis sp. KO-2023]|nr:hypothetical protein BSKO_07562 [Bryopsis sp. KO-2023]